MNIVNKEEQIMSVKAINCPNCGASGINVDTALEHSFCSYCGTTIRTKDVLHLQLDAESTMLEKLKRNAQRSFEAGQYDNARTDWQQAIEIDRTDHESYWGLVRCCMAQFPSVGLDISDRKYYAAGPKFLWGVAVWKYEYKVPAEKSYYNALTYAPPEAKEKYKAVVEKHNAKESVKLESTLYSVSYPTLILSLLCFPTFGLLIPFAAPFLIWYFVLKSKIRKLSSAGA